MANNQTVSIVYKADTNNFNNNVNRAKANMDGLSNSVERLDRETKQAKTSMTGMTSGANAGTSGFSKLGIQAGVTAGLMSGIISAAVQVGQALVDLGKQAVQLASDYQENLTKTEAVFGNNADHFVKMSNTITGATGLSKNAFLEQISLYGAMAKSMGVSTDQTMEMSEELTKLSADMSSFYNKDIEQVSTALKGVFTEETEALKEFGIVMTETNLKQFAADTGVVYSELDQAGKVLLRYNYIMEQTKIVQGDYQRTSDGLANSTRTLKANFENLLTTIGTNFLSALEKPMNAINDVFKLATFSQQDFTDQIDQARASTDACKQALAELEQAYQSGTISADEYQSEVERLNNTIADNGKMEEKASKLQQIQAQLAPTVEKIKSVFSSFSGVFSAFAKIAFAPWEGLMNLFKGFGEGFSQHLGPILEKLQPLGQQLSDLFQGIVNSPFVKLLMTILEKIGFTIGNVIGGAINFLIPIISNIISVISTVCNILGTILNPIIEFVTASVGALFDTWNAVFSTISGWATDIVSTISTKFNEILGVVSGVVSGIGDWWNGLVGQISAIAGNIYNAAIDGFKGVKDWVQTNVIDPIVGFFSDLGDKIKGGITSAVDTVKGWFGFSYTPEAAYRFINQGAQPTALASGASKVVYNYNMYTDAIPTLSYIQRQRAIVEGGQAYGFNR